MQGKHASRLLMVSGGVLLSASIQAGVMSLSGQLNVSETGSANYTIPIELPPGVAGMAPKLSLSYRSQSGNGLLGMGWSLGGMSAITRCPRTLAQDSARGNVNFDANDRFCLDGLRLVPKSSADTYGAVGIEYRTERDSLSKIVAYEGSPGDPAYFKVWTATGQVVEYGNSADSRIEAQGRTQARVWAMDKSSDRKGNYFVVTYTEDNSNGDFYPDSVNYTGNLNANTATNNTIKFVYEARPDIFPIYQKGSLIRASQRLTKIKISVEANLLYSLNLTYTQGERTRRSRLKTIQRCNATGLCGSATTATFSEMPELPSYSTVVHTDGLSGYDFVSSIDQVLPLDFDGDGKTDLLFYRPGGSVAYLLHSNGDGTFTKVYGDYPTGFNGYDLHSGADRAVAFDYDGDGKMDLMFYRPGGGEAHVMHSNGDGTFTTVYVSNGSGMAGYDFTAFSDQVLPFDFNGDGNMDLLFYRPGGRVAYVVRSNGDGSFTKVYGGFPDGIAGYDLASENDHILPIDVNNDGMTDLLVYRPNGFVAYLLRSNGDGTFSTIVASSSGFAGCAMNGANYNVTSIDMDGDGKSDIFCWRPGSRLTVVSRQSEGFPDLMTGITDGLTASSVITYSPLSQQLNKRYTRNTEDWGYPQMAFSSPMRVVTDVDVSNGIGGTRRTSYWYDTAVWDFTGRGFLGFNLVRSLDSSTGITTEVVYNQVFPYTGTVYETSRRHSSSETLWGQMLSYSSYVWTCKNTDVSSSVAYSGAPGQRCFPYSSYQDSYQYDLNAAQLPVTASTQTVDHVDQYGNPLEVTVSTTDKNQVVLKKTTVNTYDNDESTWQLGKLKSSKVTSTKY
jgi:hypothetical protein